MVGWIHGLLDPEPSALTTRPPQRRTSQLYSMLFAQSELGLIMISLVWARINSNRVSEYVFKKLVRLGFYLYNNYYYFNIDVNPE